MMILIDGATSARLGELVRGLLREHPGLDVVTEAATLEDLPAGSFVVLAVRAEDAVWLNLKRPIFSERALKVVLWSSHRETARLVRAAPDFFDWIARRFECPKGPPPHAVMGLRAALCARVQGVRFRGPGLAQVFDAAFPGRRLVRVSAAAHYRDMVEVVRASGRAWIAWRDVRSRRDVLRVSWAFAEAGRRGPFVIENDDVGRNFWKRGPAPDLWFVHGQLADPRLARAQLGGAGAPSPGRLAALLGLEPEAIALSVELLRRQVPAAVLEEIAWNIPDPGAGVVRLATERGVRVRRPGWRESPMFRRAFALDRRAWGADSGRPPSFVDSRVDVRDVGALLRARPSSKEAWRALAMTALDVGVDDVSSLWAERASTSVEALREAKRAASRALDEGPSSWLLAEATGVRAALAQGDLPAAEIAVRRIEALITAPPPEPGTEAQEPHAERAARSRGDRMLYGDLLLEVARAALAAARWDEAAALFAGGSAQHWAHSSEEVCAAFLEGHIEALLRVGAASQAEAAAREALAERHQPRRRVLAAHRALALTLAARGRFDEAEVEWRVTLDRAERELGANAPEVGRTLVALGDAVASQGRHGEAEPLAARALKIAEEHASGDAIAQAQAQLAVIHSVLGLPDAPALARRALVGLHEAFGEEHPVTRASAPHLRRILHAVR